jgi:hypothetical protein
MKSGDYNYFVEAPDLHQLRRPVGEALGVARRMRKAAIVA